MLEEMILCETPPLYSGYGRIGEQVRVPITGRHARRVLHGAMNIASGEVVLFISEVWNQPTHQWFLLMLRSRWRVWRLVLFEDRGKPHTAKRSRPRADQLGIQIRWLPKATPVVKKQALADWPTLNIDQSADALASTSSG